MTLPLLLSVPHAGLKIPAEMQDICLLGEQEIREDGDEGAAEIYLPLKEDVAALLTTDVARAILDMNRPEADRSSDGIIKTHTCWDVPVYREQPSEHLIEGLLEKFYRPYHAILTSETGKARLGVDCHTMAAVGPPVARDAGSTRPAVCLSNAGFTCPGEWLDSLAECFEQAFQLKVALNKPFQGGHIVRSHSRELPWVQVELSRSPYLPNEEKSRRVLEALRQWCTKSL